MYVGCVRDKPDRVLKNQYRNDNMTPEVKAQKIVFAMYCHRQTSCQQLRSNDASCLCLLTSSAEGPELSIVRHPSYS